MRFSKIRGCVVAPFPVSFSFFFLFLLQTANTTFLHTYLYFIYLFVCRSLHKQTRRFLRSLLCFALFLRFSALCGFIFAFGAFLFRFLFPPQPTHPTPISRYRIGGYPIPWFFYFFVFKNFLLKKCGMIYLHFECVYVGMECLHFRCGLCGVGLVFRVGWLCGVGWLCRVLNLYKLNISS